MDRLVIKSDTNNKQRCTLEWRLQLHSTITWKRSTEHKERPCVDSSSAKFVSWSLSSHPCSGKLRTVHVLWVRHLGSESSSAAGGADGSVSGEGDGQTPGSVLTGLVLTHQPTLQQTCPDIFRRKKINFFKKKNLVNYSINQPCSWKILVVVSCKMLEFNPRNRKIKKNHTIK